MPGDENGGGGDDERKVPFFIRWKLLLVICSTSCAIKIGRVFLSFCILYFRPYPGGGRFIPIFYLCARIYGYSYRDITVITSRGSRRRLWSKKNITVHTLPYAPSLPPSFIFLLTCSQYASYRDEVPHWLRWQVGGRGVELRWMWNDTNGCIM